MATKEEMQINLNNNQYVSGGTLPMNAAYLFIANPITDSMVVNAYAKTNSVSFRYALQQGGYYANHTIAGGNFLSNLLYENTKFLKAKDGTERFIRAATGNKSFSLGKKWNLNFISPATVDVARDAELKQTTGKLIDSYSKRTGLNKSSEIIRTGLGFGRNYNDFFSFLKNNGFSTAPFEEGFNRMARSGKYTPKEITKIIKTMSAEEFEFLKTFVGKDDLKQLSKIRAGENFSRLRSGISKGFNNFANNASGPIQWNAENLTKYVKDFIGKFTTTTDDVVVNGINQTKIVQLADEFVKAGGKLKNYSGVFYEGLVDDLAGAIGTKFASRTTFEKIISSPFVRLATGAALALPMSVQIPLMVATTGIGIAASIGQENAINNFVNAHQYNTSDYDNYSSDESLMSSYSSSQIQNFNYSVMSKAYSEINVASRYLNDLDSISIEEKFTSDDVESVEND